MPEEHTAAEADLHTRALPIDNSSTVIDIAAGRGRLTFPIADAGATLAAVDSSNDGIAHLAARADGYSNVDVVQGDMRSLPFARTFDGAYCMGNSFGYFHLAGVERFLGEGARVLRPGARFALESATVAESLLADLAEVTRHEFGGVKVVGRHVHDPANERIVSTLDFDDGSTRTRRVMRQLVLPSARIRQLVEVAGFTVEHMLGGVGWSEYSGSSGSLILIGVRA